MPQSLAQLYVHLVFSVKNRQALIHPPIDSDLHGYIAGTLHAIDCPSIITGGMPDHIHILFRLSKNTSLADAVRHAKVESSKWMKDEGKTPDFAWQAGYGAFSVSASDVAAVTDYIRHQRRHHEKRSFQDEFRILLQRYAVAFDEAYVWD